MAAHDDDPCYGALLDRIAAAGVFSCPSYKDGCLRRRLAVRMRACKAATYAEYDAHLAAHPEEWPRLLDALTINVTHFFRNTDVFDVLAGQVIPALWALPVSRLLIWSAGCATGEEPWALAMLFHAHASARGESGRLARVRILATDIDARSLATAQAGVYPAAALRETAAAMRDRYFAGTPARVCDEVRPLVRFERHDMLLEAPPAAPVHMIVCRNVLIYFERAAQDALLERLHAALAPGGILVLGKSETLLGANRARFTPIASGARIYARAG